MERKLLRWALIATLLLVVLGTYGCGKNGDERIEISDIRAALDETGMNIEYEKPVAIPSYLGVEEAVQGTAYDAEGRGVRFMWTVWRDAAAIDDNAQWNPRLGGRIGAPYTYGNARFFISKKPIGASADADTGGGSPYAKWSVEVMFRVGRDVLEEVSPFESHGV